MIGKKIGYIRVSTFDQNPDSQLSGNTIYNKLEKIMEIIRGKQLLNQTIRSIFYQDEEDPTKLPCSLFFCEGLGQPTYKITIEKIEDGAFIDGFGNKWVKVKNDN